ncbi:LysR family transcriptional regulator [Streptomyces sp. A7024]|uniref:LysR family transcriptional regulator n=1 Tax=Streptomyces coryli TaxID=1128680 RepID=A0A6G4U5T1_9ACTN|nr:LysR family transcriptional regulator [Streptomyces coryli]
MPRPDLDIRLLRHFVAVAETLHFGRAAQQLYVAQQALSRDVRRLEDRLGLPLLERTTRRVALTPAGELLLARARELLALHDRALEELRGTHRPLVVDVVGPGLTPSLVLDRAREAEPELEFFARFHSGTDPALRLLLDGRLDVTFGRPDTPRPPVGVGHRPVRLEPLTVLVPEHHPLARRPSIPLAALRGSGVCVRAGDHATAGWDAAVQQLLAPFGINPAGNHPHVPGGDELGRHLRDRDAPVLALTTQPEVAGAALRPLVEPVALFPWQVMWRSGLERHPGLRALLTAAGALAMEEDWHTLGTVPVGTWLPEPERLGA